MSRKPRTRSAALPDAPLDCWRHLFEVADSFRELEPWAHVAADAILGVVDPASGETDWCSVMGHNGEVFGIAMYPGNAGYATLQRILDGEVDEFDAQIAQHCVTLTFSASADLLPASKKVLKALGRSYRGATRWPELLVLEPGLMPLPPWTGAQLERVANTLTGIGALVPWAHAEPHGGACDAAGMAWVIAPPFGDADRRMAPLPVRKATPPAPPPDFDRLAAARLVAAARTLPGWWLVDWFTGVGIIDGPEAEGRPYFTAHLFVLELESGALLGMEIGRIEDAAADLQTLLLQACGRVGIPTGLAVRRPALAAALAPCAAALRVPIEVDPRLATATREVRDDMLQFFGR